MYIKCLTNNPMVYQKNYPNTLFIVGDIKELLLAVKIEIENGRRLITHPLTSSIRPDISPYKTVLLSNKKNGVDFESMNIIINAIEYTTDLMNNQTKDVNWDERSLLDFQFIDLDIIKNVMP